MKLILSSIIPGQPNLKPGRLYKDLSLGVLTVWQRDREWMAILVEYPCTRPEAHGSAHPIAKYEWSFPGSNASEFATYPVRRQSVHHRCCNAPAPLSLSLPTLSFIHLAFNPRYRCSVHATKRVHVVLWTNKI